MEQTFLTGVNIKKVRHLCDILIPLSEDKRKHLILTGKNGSGKTSVMEALVKHFQYVVSDSYYSRERTIELVDFFNRQLNDARSEKDSEENRFKIHETQQSLNLWDRKLEQWENGAVSVCNSFAILREKYQQGQFVLAYYPAERQFYVQNYKNIEKVEFKKEYGINGNNDISAGAMLTKYLVDLKATQAFSKDEQKIQNIEEWFVRFEDVLKKVFDDETLRLVFNEDTFQFTIHEAGREPFDFNTMSSGYAAVLDIINDLIMRMEAQSRLRVNFGMEGIVLIDEIETHLHLDLQKKILPMLTTLFPNIQFIVSTHSPFILNSLDNAVIYDLEKRMLVSGGMKNLPYEGIVEGYFGADRLKSSGDAQQRK